MHEPCRAQLGGEVESAWTADLRPTRGRWFRRGRWRAPAPGDKALLRLANCVLGVAHDQWQVSDRRYLADGSMALLTPSEPTVLEPRRDNRSDVIDGPALQDDLVDCPDNVLVIAADGGTVGTAWASRRAVRRPPRRDHVHGGGGNE